MAVTHGNVAVLADYQQRDGKDPAPPMDGLYQDGERPVLCRANPMPRYALALAALIHGAVALALLSGDPAPPGAQATGQAGITMAFDVVGAAPGASIEAPDVKAETETLPQQVETAEAAEPEPIPVERKVEPPQVAETSPTQAIVPVREPVPDFSAPPRRPPAPQVARNEPVVDPAPKPEIKAAPPAPSVRGAGGVDGEQATGAGSGHALAGGGLPGARPDYIAVLRAWLERHKEYPRGARLRRQEGTVVIRFAFRPGGAVLSQRIVHSSGYASLDGAAARMIERAQPMPPSPDGSRAMEVAIPVRFALR